MENQKGTLKQIANVTSYILNPLLLALILLVLLSFASTSTTSDAIKWALISIALSILPMLIIVVYLASNGKIDALFINTREQRTKIYLLAGLCTITGFITLILLSAPSLLVAAFTTGLSTAAVFMLINFWWKISIHTAMASISATLMLLMFGWGAVVTLALIPITAWARIELKSHSLAQTVTGAFLAAIIVVVVFYFYSNLNFPLSA